MISLEEYVGKWSNSPDWTDDRISNAINLLEHVNKLLAEYESESGEKVKTNPNTGSQVSGATFGGFRPQSCPIGAPKSSHKEGLACDIYDPENKLDNWIDDDILEEFGLYREHPTATLTWCHLSTKAPKSGRRSFFP